MKEIQENLESKEAMKSFRDGAQLNVYTQNFLAVTTKDSRKTILELKSKISSQY